MTAGSNQGRSESGWARGSGAAPPARRRRGARARRWLGRGLLAVLGLVLVLAAAVAIVLGPRRGRERVLRFGLVRVERALPGLAVEGAVWPHLGELGFASLHWTDGADTLLVAAGFRLRLDTGALLHRDLRIHDLELAGLGLDLPGLRQRLGSAPAPGERPAGAAAEPADVPFLRPGTWPGLPSVAVENARLAGRRLRLMPDFVLEDCILSGDFDALHGSQPRLRIRRLELHEHKFDLHADSLAATLDLGAGRLQARGAGRFAGVARFDLSASSTTSGDFELVLRDAGTVDAPLAIAAPDSAAPPADGAGAAGVQLAGRFERDHDGVREIVLRGRVTTPDVARLRQIGPMAPRLARVPDLQGIGVDLGGRVELRPAPAVDLGLRFVPNEWLGAGGVHARWAPGDTRLDSLHVELAGLRLAGRCRLGRDVQEARLRLDADGTDWLRLFLPQARVPDSLGARVEAQMRGDAERRAVDARLRLGMHRQGLRIDDLRLAVQVPDIAVRAARFDLWARQRAVAVHARGAIAAPQRIEVSLAPVELAWSAAGPLPDPPIPVPAVADPSHLVLDPATGRAELSGVRIVSAEGTAEATATASRDSGEAHVRVSWERPPATLAARLTSAGRDSVARLWPRTSGIELGGEWRPDSTGTRARLLGSIHLPGPRTFAALLPAGSGVEDLVDLRGYFEVEFLLPTGGPGSGVAAGPASSSPAGRGASPNGAARVPAAWTANLDLGTTAWIDTGLVALRGEGGAVQLDRLALAFDGSKLVAQGTARRDSVALEARLDVPDARLARRFVKLDAGANFAGRVRASLHGPPSAPDAAAQVQARFETPTSRVPRFEARATLERGLLDRLQVQAPGAQFGALGFDRLRLDYELLERSPALPARMRVDAHSEQAALLGNFAVTHADSGFGIAADTLQVRLADRELQSRGGFRIDARPQLGQFRVAGLDLAGSLGTLRADGFRTADSLRVDVDGMLELPARPQWIGVPAGLWPAALELRAHTYEADSARARLVARGLHIGPRDSLELGCDLRLDAGRAAGMLSLADARRQLIRAQGAAGADWSVEPPRFALSREVRVEVRIDSLPLQPRPGDPAAVPGYLDRTGLERSPVLCAEVDVSGTAAAPAARVSGEVLFPDWGDLSRYAVAVDGSLAPASGAVVPGGDGGLEPGLHATVRALRDGTAILDGSLQVPVRVRLDSLRAGIDPQAPLRLEIESRDLTLADLGPFLPTGTFIEGTATVRFAARGAAHDPDINGRLDAGSVSVSRPDGLRLQMGGQAAVAGSLRHPELNGHLRVDSGILPVPDLPKELHPKEGTALLWSGGAADTAAAGGPHPMASAASDTVARRTPAPGAVEPRTAGARAGVPQSSAPRVAIPPDAKIDFGIDIPSGLRIRGKGLDVELGGDLKLVQKSSQPQVTGQLEALRGTFTIKGQKIPITRGKVLFFGAVDDPTLDLLLEKKYDADNVTVRVMITGTAKEPKLELESTPQLSDTDIISYLVFGRPASQLSDPEVLDVEGMAINRASRLASAALMDPVAQRLGLEELAIESSSEGEKSTSLIVGKYLRPDLRLQYMQDLEKGRGYSVNLEYVLSRALRVVTTTSHYDQSGVKLNWRRDY